jgi:hypothetical protein
VLSAALVETRKFGRLFPSADSVCVIMLFVCVCSAGGCRLLCAAAQVLFVSAVIRTTITDTNCRLRYLCWSVLSVAHEVFIVSQLGEDALCAVCTDLKAFGLLSPLKTEINVVCVCQWRTEGGWGVQTPEIPKF